jgi:modulator of FtsH protease HflK
MPWTDHSKPGEREAAPWSAPPGEASEDAPTRAKGSGPWDEPKGAARQTRRSASPPVRLTLDTAARGVGARVAALAERRPALPRQAPLDRRLAWGLLAAAVAAWAATGVEVLHPGETAVTSRFGAVTAEQAGPALAYHLPWPIEQARVLSTHTVERLEDGGDSDGPMLTADDMLVQPDFDVAWRVTDPRRYLLAGDVPEVVRAAAVQGLRRAIGRAPLATLQHGGVYQVQGEAAAALQSALDRQGVGATVVSLQLHGIAPAAPVTAAFRDVAAAREAAQTGLAQAAAYRARAVAAARQEAGRTVRAAAIYGEQAAHRADGEAARFALLDAQYRHFPEVTRERLYTEMMEHVLRASNKVVVQPGKGAAVSLPPELFKPHPTPDAAPAPAKAPAE